MNGYVYSIYSYSAFIGRNNGLALLFRLSTSDEYRTMDNADGVASSHGSIAALLLALFNLGVAVLVYLPFVVISNKAQTQSMKKREEDIANALKF